MMLVEIKNTARFKPLNPKSKQFRKYLGLDIPVLYIRSFNVLPKALKYIQSVRAGEQIHKGIRDAFNLADKRLESEIPYTY